jgi:response regulator NasT
MAMSAPRWRVVVVDDHAASRAAVAETVAARGGRVVAEGERLEEAVPLVERCQPDVTIVAVGLDRGDGIEAARRIAALGRCPVVLLTSHTAPEVVARAVEAGVLGFLAKPLRPAELGPALDVAVSRFRDLEAVRRENASLREDLETRKLVERAKGVLMQRQGLSEAEAYRRLQKTAMDTRRAMREIAQAVLLSDEVAGPAHQGAGA